MVDKNNNMQGDITEENGRTAGADTGTNRVDCVAIHRPNHSAIFLLCEIGFRGIQQLIDLNSAQSELINVSIFKQVF